MRYKLLGHTGARVSEFSLGTMTINATNPWNWGAKSKEESLNILRSYYEAGGNFIDTANNYTNGESEKVIGEFINGYDRDEFFIATKFTLHNNETDYSKKNLNFGGNSRKNMLRSVKASLDRLNTDYIDMLYLHVWDYTTSIKEVMKSLNSLVESHMVNYIAISDTPVWVAAQAQMLARERGWEEFAAFQFPFNIGRQEPQHELIPFARYNDIAMIPWNVLGTGIFTGKYTRGLEVEEGRISKSDKPEELLRIARVIDEIADELSVTSVAVTVAWTKQVDNRMIPILGATRPEHIQQVVDGLDLVLDTDHLKRLDEIIDFKLQFPQSFTSRENVKNLIHGESADKLQNHRFQGF